MRMKRLKNASLDVVLSLLLSMLLTATASAQVSPIKAKLLTTKKSYGFDEPIGMQVTVYNDIAQEVISSEGFQDQNFHLMITFTGPDGKAIRSRFDEGVYEPPPPPSYGGKDVALVEIIYPDWDHTTVMDDTRAFFDLWKPGLYKAQLFFSLEKFSTYFMDPVTEAQFAYLDDPGRQNFDPVASAEISFEILPPEAVVESAIEVTAKLLTIDFGSSPEVTQSALADCYARLIRRSDISEDYYPISYKTYALIWQYAPVVATALTDSNGVAKFINKPKDDYVIIAHHPEAINFTHMGTQVKAKNPNWLKDLPIVKSLVVIEMTGGKKFPGTTHERTGSELLIVEPEFVEWDSTQAHFPFVFESEGDWKVTTSVSPPKGFVTDNKSLSATVTNEIEAVQFTITDTDRGSRWEETEVTYSVKHKGKTEKIKSKIGVKLSKKLAKKKGLGIYGHTPSPGPFKGGKKVANK
jgi:hypothetical protein